MNPVDALAKDIADHGIAVPSTEWTALGTALHAVEYTKGECIYRMEDIGSSWLFLADGVTASIQTHADGTVTIARFFEDGQMCGNLTSTWSKQYASDDLVAVSDVLGVEIASDIFREHMVEGGGEFARYLRIKAMDTLCFDKEVIVAKTHLSLEKRYRFLEEHYRRVIGAAMQKQLAAFAGVTPEALSRFLKRRSADSPHFD